METQKTIKKAPQSQVLSMKPAGTAKSKPRKTSGSRKAKTDRSILTEELIAERAWHIWDRRGRLPGRDEDNWFEAVNQLREELSSN